MAIVECIPEKKQTPSAQKGVIDYCTQPSKTFDRDEDLAYVSGYNCVAEFANESFLATQKIFGHKSGDIRFYHYVQSFKVGENITPETSHEIGMKLAQKFGNREVLIATHIDKEHIHNHLVVCAYDFQSGIKLHNNKFFLGELRQASDDICKEYGLAVLGKYDPNKKSARLYPKEYRAAINGNSWKIQLCVAIDHCMARCKNEKEFKAEMKKLGYGMIWTPERKYITYILNGEDGNEKRVRDIKLHEEKYRKENMEREFRIRAELYGQAQGEECSVTATQRRKFEYGSDSADQRRGMEAPDVFADTVGGGERRFFGAESDFVGCGEQIYRDDGKGGGRARKSHEKGGGNDIRGSCQTGWECERESLGSYTQKYFSGRGDMVVTSDTHGSTDDIGVAVMGARELGNIANLIDDEDETEEEKRQKDARNAGAGIGFAVGALMGVALASTQNSADDETEEDDEEYGFDITM